MLVDPVHQWEVWARSSQRELANSNTHTHLNGRFARISRHSQPIFLRALVAISRVVKFSRVAHPKAALVAKRPTIRR
jgi:hypothetical protein